MSKPPEPYSEEDIALRGAGLAEDAGEKRLRQISNLLGLLTDPTHYTAPQTPQEHCDLFMKCHRFSVRDIEINLRPEEVIHFEQLVSTILDIPGLDEAGSKEDLADILSPLISKEIERRLYDKEQTSTTVLTDELFRKIAEGIDWHRFFFIVHGVEIEGPRFDIGDVTLFPFNDEWIDFICAPGKECDERGKEFLKHAKEFMRKSLKKRFGLTFAVPGSDHQADETAFVVAEECIKILRFACCLLYPEMATVNRIHIEIESYLSGPPPLVFRLSQRRGQLSKTIDRAQHGVLKLNLDRECQQILERNNFGDLVRLCFLKGRSKLEDAIVRSMEWIGDAYGDPSPAAAFSKYWFAIETLVSTRPFGTTEYLKRSIPVLLAHGGFQVIKKEEIPQTARRVTKLYGMRSAAAHRGKRSFTEEDLVAVREYASLVLLTYFTLRNLGYKDPKEINAETDRLYLKSLKFVAVQGARRYHRATCTWAQQNVSKPLFPFESPAKAEKKGLAPCRICAPEKAG